MFAGKKSAQIREILISESAWEEMTCLFAPSLYIPHIVLTELIPEAARVVPVMDGDNQKGTIIVSTEEIFDGNNKEHIGKANDIEIKLLDLGLLPLMTEL